MSMAAGGNGIPEHRLASGMDLRPGSSTSYHRPTSQGNTSFLGLSRPATPSLQPLAIPGGGHLLPQQGIQHGPQPSGYLGGMPPSHDFAFAGMQESQSPLYSQTDSYVSTPTSARHLVSAPPHTVFSFDGRTFPVNNGSFSAGGYYGMPGSNPFGNFRNSGVAVGPLFDPSTGETSHNPIQAYPSPASATLMSQNLSQASHTSHLSSHSAPASATVAYHPQSFPSTYARPHHMAGTSPAGMYLPNGLQPSLHPTSPSPFPPTQDNGEVLYGVGVQNMPSAVATPLASPMPQGMAQSDFVVSQNSPDIDFELPEAEFSQNTVNALVEADSQYSQYAPSLPVLPSFQSQTAQEPHPQPAHVGYGPSVHHPATPTRKPSQLTVTSENSSSLDSSSPLSSVSVAAAGGHQQPKFRSAPASAPASAAGDVAMTKKVAGVPVSMQNHFNVGTGNHNVNNAEGSNAKRRRSDDLDGATGLSKKMAKGKKADGLSCVPCAIKRKKCDNGSPCDKCKGKTAAYPICVSQDFSEQNVFLDGLRSDLKEKAIEMIAGDKTMSMNYTSDHGFPLGLLSEVKFGNGDVYKPLLMGDPSEDKSLNKPFYQASILLQAHEFLTIQSNSGLPNALNFTPEVEDNLRLMQALSAARAFRFIKKILNKNRMNEETPKHSRRALNILIQLCMFFEQTLAYEKMQRKESLPLTDKLAAQHRDLSYHLAYRVRFMADYTYGEQSGLSKFVEISAESVNLKEGFWDLLQALRNDPSQFLVEPAGVHLGAEGWDMEKNLHAPTTAAGNGDASGASTAPAAFDTAANSPAAADRPHILVTRPTGLGTHTAQAPGPNNEQKKNLTEKLMANLGRLGPKKRKRKDDDMWVDSRDIPDADIIFHVRTPVHDDKFDDLIGLMHDVHIDAGEGSAHGHGVPHPSHHAQQVRDDGQMFCTSPVGDDLQWPPSGDARSPSDLFDGLDMSTSSVPNSFDDGTGDNSVVLDDLYDMDGDRVLAASLRAAQDADDAEHRFDYGTESADVAMSSAAVHPDLTDAADVADAADAIAASPQTAGPIPGPVAVEVDASVDAGPILTTAPVAPAAPAAPVAPSAPSAPSASFVSSAPASESGSVSRRPSSARSSLLLARSRSIRTLAKGKNVVKNLLGRKGE
ncbi:hypothetical protein HMPREF1624_06915 [Sporothrix schenckii ATCC 58251]|uniref:Zn(2)-C6 fungal-type domain-containing protein n=1 Tax=Sporothrix schenckii (strain ATCC 58251 / de Perez 2211183) TaxID=1391915 RepID=U7PP38_SPOS1|nr:hypothetical protein HMPREF1624_06915 [Sporothrix schenckii ATCC 58251]